MMALFWFFVFHVFHCHVMYHVTKSYFYSLWLTNCQGTPCSKQALCLKFKWQQPDSNPQPLNLFGWMFECLFTNKVVVGSNPFAVTYPHIAVSFLKHEIADRRHSILLQVNHQSNAFDKSVITTPSTLLLSTAFSHLWKQWQCCRL